ncbi:riboflavin synthase [Romboutsia lituseburensis]|uniref:riboflavin synthase n=1 Tax=Romboutsia lituseburensis TaxID=1537 RepID=UPI0022EA1477|nr:riboflavin synthase [Romboutsia lituseburensis]
MFTGIIEEIGIVKDIKKSAKSSKIIIEANKILEKINLGDSISTNGVCLTASGINENYFEADVMAETLRRSNIGKLKIGSNVNLERALCLEGGLGGHIVSGHIDGTGEIISFKKEENAIWLTIKTSKDLLKYIVEKGSIAIDGISLTVAYVDDYKFKVSVIPHTKRETTLLNKNVKDTVNIECDMIGKYIEKLLGLNKKNIKSNLNEGFLKDNGFI